MFLNYPRRRNYKECKERKMATVDLDKCKRVNIVFQILFIKVFGYYVQGDKKYFFACWWKYCGKIVSLQQ